MLSDVGGKKIRFGPWPDIMLITYLKKYSFWIWHQTVKSLIIPLHCLSAKSDNRTSGQFECDITLFLFWFRSITCIVRFLFQSLLTFSRCANERLIAKRVLKMWIKNISWCFYTTAYTRIQSHEKADSEASAQPWIQHIFSL